jgi:hypothetical protein
MQRRHLLAAAVFAAVRPAAAQTPSDHGHGAWTALLKKHVVLLEGGRASQVR